jgi:hypothetical protein
MEADAGAAAQTLVRERKKGDSISSMRCGQSRPTGPVWSNGLSRRVNERRPAARSHHPSFLTVRQGLARGHCHGLHILATSQSLMTTHFNPILPSFGIMSPRLAA